MRHRVLLIAVSSLIAGASLVVAASTSFSGLDASIPELMETWNVPGLAIAMVDDGEVVFARGYGVLEAGRAAAVDVDTLFAIGSITKSFTAACLGLLVDEGKIGWDDRVADHLPALALKDPWVSSRATIRDFLSHRSGVEPNNLVFWGTKLRRDELVHRLRFLDVDGYGSSFRYNNLTYLAAGQTIETVDGQSWDQCVRERIFAPLGMERSTVRNREFDGDANVASAHAEIEGEVRGLTRQDGDNVAPAGAIYSSASEMAKWLLVHLGDGVLDDRQVLPKAIVHEMRTPQVLINEPIYEVLQPAANFRTYGLGWTIRDFEGRLVVSHGGQTQGMTAQLGMMPDERFGYVVLSNARTSWLPPLLGYMIHEIYLGGEPGKWTEFFEAVRQRTEELMATAAVEPPAEARPPLDLESYAGTYRDGLYGDAEVVLDEGRLVIELADLGHRGVLTHSHNDVFEVSWDAGDHSLVGIVVPLIQFHLDPRGLVRALTLDRGELRRVE